MQTGLLPALIGGVRDCFTPSHGRGTLIFASRTLELEETDGAVGGVKVYQGAPGSDGLFEVLTAVMMLGLGVGRLEVGTDFAVGGLHADFRRGAGGQAHGDAAITRPGAKFRFGGSRH